MSHAFYLTGGMTGAVLILGLMICSLLMLAAESIRKIIELERSVENVRHRPSEQNPHL